MGPCGAGTRTADRDWLVVPKRHSGLAPIDELNFFMTMCATASAPSSIVTRRPSMRASMKLRRVRLVCNAPNCFSPAAVLHQNFVAPQYTTHQQRFSSTAPAPAPADNQSPDPTDDTLPAHSTFHRISSFAAPRIAYVTTGKLARNAKSKEELGPAPKSTEDWERVLGSAPDDPSSARDNRGDRRSFVKASEIYIEQLLLRAQLAFDDREEYAPMLVRPLPGLRMIPEQKWPWSTKTLPGRSDPMQR